MVAVDLVEGRITLVNIAVPLAATILRVGPASVRTVLRASPRDRLALVAAGASIRSIKRSSAPLRPQPTLLDMWRSASDADRLTLLRSFDPLMLADLVAVRCPTQPNGGAQHHAA
jgi:hypothetical protein